MLEARDKGGTLPHEICWEGGGEGSVIRLVGRTCCVVREGEASLVEKKGMREEFEAENVHGTTESKITSFFIKHETGFISEREKCVEETCLQDEHGRRNVFLPPLYPSPRRAKRIPSPRAIFGGITIFEAFFSPSGKKSAPMCGDRCFLRTAIWSKTRHATLT